MPKTRPQTNADHKRVMKSLLKAVTRAFLALLLLVGRPHAFAQGTVFFSNLDTSAGVNAPVFDIDGLTRLTGASFFVQLLAGPSPTSLAPAPPVASGFNTGYWGSAGDSLNRIIPNVGPNSVAYVQIQVWSTALGSTYDQVVAANGRHGVSAVFTVVTGGDTQGGTLPPSFPGVLTGFRGFELTGKDPASTVPEPSAPLLLGMAAGAAALFRRRGFGGQTRAAGENETLTHRHYLFSDNLG